MADQEAPTNPELSLVNEYLKTEFQPKHRAISARIRDPEVRRVAMDKTIRHFYHWREERKLLRAREAVKTGQEASNGDHVDGPGEGQDGNERAWEEEPATERQLAYLRDRGIRIPEGLTKGEASRLISTHIEGRPATA